MSLFGSLMGDFDDDVFGNHMNAMNMQMRSMNRLMNSLMPDPFNMLAPFDAGFQQNALMERQNGPHMGGLFGFPTMPPMQMMHSMPNMNRLLSADIGNNGASFCSSSVITMSSGPDGRPQIYQATSSTKTGPGGIRETRRTVQDSMNGVKKMAIGHHIGDRAHIIEKEQDVRSGQLEERQEFINLDEDEAEDFDREFTTKASSGRVGGHRAIAGVPTQTLTIEPLDDDDDDDEVVETTAASGRQHNHHTQQRPSSSGTAHQRRYMPALPAPPPPQQQQQPSHQNSSTVNKTTAKVTTQHPTNVTSSSNTSDTTNIRSPPPTTSGSANAAATASSSYLSSSSNTNPYLSTTPRRSSAYRSGSHISGASPRRPLRTPPSSPLATTPTMHNHSTASSPSVHPHPYNSSAARRSHHHNHHHRSKHAKQQHATNAAASATSNNSNKSPTNHREEQKHQN